MRNQEIFDANEDLGEVRQARRLRFFRFGIPIASVALMMLGLIGIAVYSYQSNREGTLALSRDLLVVLEQQVRLEVGAHFKPADNAVRALTAASSGDTFEPRNRQTLERFGMRLLQDAPMIALISVADPAGDYLMLRRNDVGGVDSKFMERRDGKLTTTWTRRDADGKVTGTDLDPADTYDPRTRPWFTDATEAQDVTWTDAYVFFTDKKPGITASLAARDADGHPTTIVGVDIYLDELNDFLAGLRISGRSESLIIDEQGRVIAQRHRSNPTNDENGELRLANITELNRPYVTEAYDRVRVGPRQSLTEIDHARYVILGSSLSNIITRNWMLLFVVPENDFVGFVGQNTRNSLYMSAAVVALALFIATLLIRQSFAADRARRAMTRREGAMERRELSFAELGALAGEPVVGLLQLARFTEAVARAAKAASVRVWRFELNQSTAFCLDAYDADSGSHTAGIEIARDQIPELFQAVSQGEETIVEDARTDPRLAEVRSLYPANAGKRNLLLFPLSQQGAIVGYLALEHVPLDADSGDATLLLLRSFARWLGTHLPQMEDPGAAQAQQAHEEVAFAGAPLAAEPAALRTASITGERQRLAMRRFNGKASGAATVFPRVTSMTLRLDLNSALSADAQAPEDLLENIAEAARVACDRHHVRYLKIVGNEIFAADGFDGDGEAAAVNLANAALELRDHCGALSRRYNRTPLFAMGIDSGVAVGTAVGDQGPYNIWGESVQLGQALAATAAAGSIHVSQSAYEYLNSRFLFRRVGAYYLERIGEMTTFTLRGRL
ncbi:MAG TPA: adenylate/guanylate cyclase domain-containing protein [Alphaproteobacteria bacterium]|jgi:hypothetical protein